MNRPRLVECGVAHTDFPRNRNDGMNGLYPLKEINGSLGTTALFVAGTLNQTITKSITLILR